MPDEETLWEEGPGLPAVPSRARRLASRIAEVVVSGAVAGTVAGAIMGGVATGWAAVTGMGAALPAQAVAATAYGVGALVGDAEVIAFGAVLHLVVSAALGMVFALFVHTWHGPRTALALGLLYGIAVWLLATWVALPRFDPVMAGRVALVPIEWLVLHLAYGAGLLVVPGLERRVAHLPPRRAVRA